TVRSTNLAFSGFGLVPISMIAHENLIRSAVHIDSMGIGQPRRRTLDKPQRLLVLLERSRIDADSVDMLCRDKQFVILNIQKDTCAGAGNHTSELSSGTNIAATVERVYVQSSGLAADRIHFPMLHR